MPLLGVNYHYVGMPEYLNSGVHGLTKKEFLQQLGYLKENFILIGLNDLEKIKIENNNYCLITFDDGLRCHYEVIFQEIKKEYFPAVFFVNTMPIFENKATLTHKTHFVRSQISIDNIYAALVRFCKIQNISLDGLDDHHINSVYRYDDLQNGRLKYIINYIISESERNIFISHLFDNICSEESEFVEKWYLNKNQIKEMNSFSVCIGSHSHSHIPLSRLNKKDTFNELTKSKILLEEELNNKIECFSYPLGGSQAFTKKDTKLVRDAGYKYGFTMEREQNITFNNKYLLARIDCNDLPAVGRTPLFKIINSKFHRLDNSLSQRKENYYE